MLLHDYDVLSVARWLKIELTRRLTSWLTHSSMSTLARNFWTRLMPMEGVADASATGRSVRSPPDPISSSGQIDHIEERTPSARRDAPL